MSTAPKRTAVCLERAYIPELPNFHGGKVRDSYALGDGRHVIIATDRQSAFDQMLSPVPLKGQVLTRLSSFWFRETASICPNHLIEVPDPNVMIARSLKMIPLEVVVRAYLTGTTGTSIWMQYESGVREFGGVELPDGLAKNGALPYAVITPTSKAPLGQHDVPVGERAIAAAGLCTQQQWERIKAASLGIFAFGQKICAERGIILVDTKYEFGLDGSGAVVLADEVHTPDSSRFWLASSYAARLAAGSEPEMLDKEYVRLWIKEHCRPYAEPIPPIPEDVRQELSARYVRAFEAITGETIIAPGKDPLARIRRNLRRSLPQFFQHGARQAERPPLIR
ncbi:MAG: phosphoribosylaminoimidazolesuccinocarboxamide synthase [Alphaproteobacteria bacterium]